MTIEHCPICKNEAFLSENDEGRKYVICSGCYVMGDTGSADFAVSNWNERCQDTKLFYRQQEKSQHVVA